jgi:hypothetical protein
MVQQIILSFTATKGKNILLGYQPHLAVKPTDTAGRFKIQMNFKDFGMAYFVNK